MLNKAFTMQAHHPDTTFTSNKVQACTYIVHAWPVFSVTTVIPLLLYGGEEQFPECQYLLLVWQPDTQSLFLPCSSSSLSLQYTDMPSPFLTPSMLHDKVRASLKSAYLSLSYYIHTQDT